MRRRAAAAVVAAVAALASCADDGPYAGPSAIGDQRPCPPIAGYSFPVADHGSADVAGARTIDITGGDSFFAPTCALNVPAGAVTLRVTNTGTMKHNVTVVDQGIDVDILPGETVEIDVDVPEGGAPLVYLCKYHRTSGMVGALAVGTS